MVKYWQYAWAAPVSRTGQPCMGLAGVIMPSQPFSFYNWYFQHYLLYADIKGSFLVSIPLTKVFLNCLFTVGNDLYCKYSFLEFTHLLTSSSDSCSTWQ